MKLIISGGGKPPETSVLDKAFVKMLPKDKKAIYLPQARKESEYEDSLNWVKENIFKPNEFPLTQVEMWDNLKGKTYDSLKDVGGIFIGGGNTFKLMKELRDCGFLDLLKHFAKKGGVIYGGSAGAVILGKDIRTAEYGHCKDENQVDLNEFDCLNFINEFSILCHYHDEDETDKKDAKFLRKKFGLKILGLPEGSGLIIKDKTAKAIGEVSVFS